MKWTVLLLALVGCTSVPRPSLNPNLLQKNSTTPSTNFYATLGETELPLPWTPLNPTVTLDGVQVLSQVQDGKLRIYLPPYDPYANPPAIGPAAVWGGRYALAIQDGSSALSGTLQVLGQDHHQQTVDRDVVVALTPLSGPALQNHLASRGITGLTLLEDTPLGGSGPCKGHLVRFGKGKNASFTGLLRQLDQEEQADPSQSLTINPEVVTVINTTPVTGYQEVRSNFAYQKGLRGSGVTVAVLDTGLTVPQGMNWAFQVAPGGYNFVDRVNDVSDGHGHGTAVADLAVGLQNGVAYQAKVLPLKVCDKSGRCKRSDVAKAICHALNVTDPRMLVLNLSFGSDTGRPGRDLLEVLLKHAVARGALVAASAGNHWEDYQRLRRLGLPTVRPPRNYPADLEVPGLLMVGATLRDSSGAHQVTPFSQHSPHLDLVAPGASVRALTPSGTEGLMTGTSFSTPLVAGALALWRQAYPDASPTWIEQQIKDHADVRLLTSDKPTRLPEASGTGLLSLEFGP